MLSDDMKNQIKHLMDENRLRINFINYFRAHFTLDDMQVYLNNKQKTYNGNMKNNLRTWVDSMNNRDLLQELNKNIVNYEKIKEHYGLLWNSFLHKFDMCISVRDLHELTPAGDLINFFYDAESLPIGFEIFSNGHYMRLDHNNGQILYDDYIMDKSMADSLLDKVYNDCSKLINDIERN